MHDEVIENLKKDLMREKIKQVTLKEFYLQKAEGKDKEESAKLKLKAAQLEDNITFNTELLDFLATK